MANRFFLLTVAGSLLLAASHARASIIVDSAMESGNGWTTSGLGFAASQGSLSPLEGSELVRVNYSFFGTTVTSPLLGGALAAGTYTLQFAVGSDTTPNIIALPLGLTFAGIQPTTSSTPQPALGSWALWTAQYVVNHGDAAIGNPLQFSADIFTDFNTQGAFDGVGSLSPDGNGFLVDFVAAPAVPEAGESLVAMCGLTGLLCGMRRRKKS